MNYYLNLLLLLATLSLGAQTFKEDMAAVYDHFGNPGTISFRINYVLKASHAADSRIISQSTGRYRKKGNAYISVFDEVATLVTPRNQVLINHNEKRIRVKELGPRSKAKTPDFLAQFKVQETLIAKTTRLDSGALVKYRVTLKPGSSPFSCYEICFERKTRFVRQVTLFYAHPLPQNENYKITGSEIPRLDIVFYDFNNKEEGTEQELDPSYYYVRNQKKIIPTQYFKSYDIKEIY